MSSSTTYAVLSQKEGDEHVVEDNSLSTNSNVVDVTISDLHKYRKSGDIEANWSKAGMSEFYDDNNDAGSGFGTDTSTSTGTTNDTVALSSSSSTSIATLAENEGENGNAVSQSAADHLGTLTEQSPTSEKVGLLLKQAFPVMATFLLSNGANFINLIFAGHLLYTNGDKTVIFAGVSLANMFANVSCQSLLIGMTGALETLGSQNNGAKNYKEVGYILQRSYAILGLMTLPCIVLWWMSGSLFAMFGVDKDVCDVITTYLRIRSVVIPLDVFNISYEKYLMSIGIMNPSMYAFIVFNLCVLLLDSLFIYVFHWGYRSLAVAWIIACYAGALVLRLTSWNDPAVIRTLQPWSCEALRKWWEFIKLGLPGTIMLCSEWWAYEILTMFASLLGTAEVAAQTVIIQTAALAFMIPLGIGIATTSMVGNSLGADKRALAIQIGRLALLLILVIEIIISVIMYTGGPSFMRLFTDDKSILYWANKAIPFLTAFVFIDGLQGVSAGVLRGAGKQMLGAFTNVISFYVIGLPMAWYLCFSRKFGVNGLMLGVACGTMFQDFVCVTMIVGFESYVFVPTIEKQHKLSSSSSSSSSNSNSNSNSATIPLTKTLDNGSVDNKSNNNGVTAVKNKYTTFSIVGDEDEEDDDESF